MLRLFVGIALPPEQKLALSLLANGLPGARWVDAGNYHLTLRFIGEVDEGTAADIDAGLAPIESPSFDLSLVGVGHFGARMLWAGVERSPPLVHLQGKVEAALIRLGLEPKSRRYTPHVSLARLRDPPVARLQEYLAAHALFRAAPFKVGKFSLVASYLSKSGAIYEDQADYVLRGA